MLNKKNSLSDRMRMLLDTYARELPNKIGDIEGKWRILLCSGDYQNYINDVLRSFHTLAGSASTFGYVHLSEVARNGEELLKSMQKDRLSFEETAQAINVCLEKMKKMCENQSVHSPAKCAVSQNSAEGCEREKRTVFLVEDDVLLASSLALQLECFGYDVTMFHDLREMEQVLTHVTPAAIIMDMMFPEGETAGADAINRWRLSHSEYIPVLFISRRNDIISRLEAVKAGSDAYFLKPVRVSDLIVKLDELIYKADIDPYRILIVDDDKALAEYYSMLLEQHGMESSIVNNPLEVLEYLSIFSPDLILLDLNMPGCDGYHLAKVIRQVPAYFSIPIVFLSGETQLDLQLQAMGIGGDDFLIKPVDSKYFISSVRIRAERMRMLRSFMERDGLSGLYTHTPMKGCIEQEFLRSVRNNSKMTLAILDLDRFKTVNDTYGHSTGDMVIVVLSRLIRQRLRKSDIIGRMGGEEFALILPDTPVDCGYSIIEEIRENYELIEHETKMGTFCSTFSCGIAQMPGYTDANSFYDAADMALFDAKKMGRNRISVAKKA